ncbi:MAG: YceI family protein [Thermoleophilaceae bacterium]
MAQAFGPENARLTVRTARTGAAAKAGHDLLIEVTAWSGMLDPDGDPAVTLSADPRSLRVLEGSGGMQALDEDDRAGIEQTIDDEVLRGAPIEFRSTRFDGLPGRVEGELELAGERRPIGFELGPGEDGGLTGRAVLRQSDWGMKPYSALFGTLKVADEVEVTVEGRSQGT